MKRAECPCCGAAMRRNGGDRGRLAEMALRALRGVQDRLVRRQRRQARGVPGVAALEGEAGGHARPDRTFRRLAADFWPIWPMPEPAGEVFRVLSLDGIWLDRDLVVPMAYDGVCVNDNLP